MKERKVIYLQNEEELEAQINTIMDEIDMNQASMLLNEMDINVPSLDSSYIQDIKERTFKKLELEADLSVDNEKNNSKMQKESLKKRKDISWKKYLASAAVIILVLVGMKHESIVLAFQELISLIPGVGIVDSSQGAEYQLKEQVSAKNDQCSLKVSYVTATEDTMTVRFELKGTFKERQELDRRKERDNIEVYLLVNNKKFQRHQGGSGAGLSDYAFSYNFDYTFELDKKYIDTRTKYTLVCETFDLRVSFYLDKTSQYHSLDEIGATQTNNDISLTASAFLKDGQLSVNIYPLNNSNYNLISFNQEYNHEYFGTKMMLNTDKGTKNYIPPSYYGTNLNAPFLFDVSDGSGDFELLIPFVAVESKEKKTVVLPIPEEGKKIEVNEEITFEDGSAIIKSVKRLSGDSGNEFGYLQISLDYSSLNEKRQLVSVEFTGKNSIGFYSNSDDQNRRIAISYMLNESDTKELKLSVINPRYVLMDPYQLKLNIK